jgi:transcriptional regulator NrdR family protein
MKYHRVFSIACFCPKCGEKGLVIDSRIFKYDEGLTRQRNCPQCGYKWLTIELNYYEFKEKYDAGKFD